MENIVKFIFTKFIEIDSTGKEKTEKYGYRLFDEYGQYCDDTLDVGELKEITAEKVLHMIKEDYSELYETVMDKGFYYDRKWIVVDETGEIVKD